jgi:hypothetical protein
MPQGGIPMPAGMESALPFSPGAEAPQQFAYGGDVKGSGTLSLQVPISVGDASGATPSFAGQLGQAPQGLAGLLPKSPSGFGSQMEAPAYTQGFDPLAVGANPLGFSQYMEQMRQQEQQMPGATMLGASNRSAGFGVPQDTYENYLSSRSPMQQDVQMSRSQFEDSRSRLNSSPFKQQFFQQLGDSVTTGMRGPASLFAEGGEVEVPQGYAIGGIVRGAQMVGDKLGQYGSMANAAMGRMFMQPQGISQPILENVRGPGGRYTAQQIVTGGEALTAPTFTQGLMQGTARLADQYPRLASMMAPAAGVLGLANIPSGGPSGPSAPGTDMASQIPRDTIEDRVANSVLNKPPILSMSFDKPFTTTRPDLVTITEGPRPAAPPIAAATTAAEQAAIDERQLAATEKVDTDPLGSFINQKLKLFDEREAKGKPLSKVDRIRKGQAEYAPLFEELLGSDKEAAKINALLLLSEAGLKLASTAKPTFAMAVADAFSGVPRGVAAIAAQERELALKTKTASLQQAISDVGAEDAAAAARQKLILEYTMKQELEKAKQGGGNVIYENAGAGGLIGKDKAGNYKGFFINPESPDYKEIAENPILVNNFTSNNPFAKDLGKATTVTAQSLKKREEIQEKMNVLTGLIAKVDTGLSQVTNAFSPGTFVNNLANNVVVPLVPNFILRPDVDQAATIAVLNNVFSDITRGNAEVGGKLSVQGEKWARENAKAIKDPADLLKNPELAAKVFGTIKTGYLNEYAMLASQLGIGTRNIVVTTPPTGTKNDPFVIPGDSEKQQQMLNYLKIQFGAVDDPKAMIYVRNPDGIVRSTPIQNLFKPVGQ